MTQAKRVLVLGSTGSIGQQTLDVIKQHPEKLKICGLACGSNAHELLQQARIFNVHALALGMDAGDNTSESASALLAQSKSAVIHPADVTQLETWATCQPGGWFGRGADAVLRLIELTEPDIVVNALVGAAGLRASVQTLQMGCVLALANKESLVVGGDLIMPLVYSMDGAFPNQHLMPIDSEHGAIFQCLLGEDMSQVSKLWVTASGGPFRGMNAKQLAQVDAAAALAHPTWNMGSKITIDSSTLMNKGLEVIEAHHLFNMPYNKIEVVVQPQSAIHSMVEFSDGSVKAHLGTTDMRIPIQFALSYPDRWDAPVTPLDFRVLGSLDFEAPDAETFRCLALAREAGRQGGTLPDAMNAANEVAVAAFLNGACGFLDIAQCVEHVMNAHAVEQVQSLEQLIEVDAWAREAACMYLNVSQ